MRHSSSPDPDGPEYRSIYRKMDADRQLPNHVDSIPVTDGMEHILSQKDEETKQRNIELSRLTKSEPNNLIAWFDLINHQNKMACLGRSTSSLSNSEWRAVSDVKISIYEQALMTIGISKPSQIKLLVALLEEATKVWDSSKLSKRWQEVLKNHPSSLELWTRYLNFIQTDFIRFRYDKAKLHYTECLKIISQTLQETEDSETRADLLKIQIVVTVRLTGLMREAGFREHAIAIWQVLFENNFFRPKSLSNVSCEELLDNLDEFWESEVLRIGEVDAAGWSEFDPDSYSLPNPKTDGVALDTRENTRFTSFTKEESLYAEHCALPGRTQDDGIDDPYHVVLFSDISDLVRHLLNKIPEIYLVEAFVGWFGLPSLSSIGLPTALPADDPFLRNTVIEIRGGDKLDDSSSGDAEHSTSFRHHLSKMLQAPLPCMQITTEELFKNAFATTPKGTDLSFIREVLKKVTSVSNNDLIAEYYLSFLNKYFPADAINAAKVVLKRMNSSLRLYNAYALIESSKGHWEKAKHVFSTALGMSIAVPDLQRQDGIVVLRNWVWETLRLEGPSIAFETLLSRSYAEKPDSSEETEALSSRPSAILKARQYLSGSRDHALSNNRLLHAITYTECLALLYYFQSDCSISSALPIFGRTSEVLTQRGLATSPANELIHQAVSVLLEFHLTHQKIFQPSLVREELSTSILLFPTNTRFLALFAANEARFRIDDRLRTMVKDVLLQPSNGPSSIVGLMFAIFVEKERGNIAGATEHSVRALYEDAVESVAGWNSLALWRSFVEFEIDASLRNRNIPMKSSEKSSKASQHRERGHLGPKYRHPMARAKEIYFRGLSRLPWCKEYMMMAFSTHFQDVMTVEELRRVWNVMGEKELRTFGDLEPVFEDLENGGSVHGGTALRLPDDREEHVEDEGWA